MEVKDFKYPDLSEGQPMTIKEFQDLVFAEIKEINEKLDTIVRAVWVIMCNTKKEGE